VELLVYPKTTLKCHIGNVEVKINAFLTVAVN